MKNNHKRLSASINIKEKLKDLDEVSIAIIPQPSANQLQPQQQTLNNTTNTTTTTSSEPMDTSESPATPTTTPTLTTTTTPINKEILQENINSASNNIVAK
jgi:hypothetical protein